MYFDQHNENNQEWQDNSHSDFVMGNSSKDQGHVIFNNISASAAA